MMASSLSRTGVVLFAWALAAAAQTPNVTAIMSQVAANQDRAEQLRNQYSYTQKVRIRAIHSSGKLSREEFATYNVAPTENSTKKDLVSFKGRYQDKTKLVDYEKPGQEVPGRNLDVDAQLVPELRDDLMSDKHSKDGIAADLFPLTTAQQKHYDFRFVAEETYKGRSVYRISFQPKKHQQDDDDTAWAGDAVVDKADLQPISVVTHLAKPIPFFVRTALGTNLHQLGFAISYARFDPGVYFPVSYGGEFDIRAVFFYKRTLTLSLENSDFRRGQAESNITYQPPK